MRLIVDRFPISSILVQMASPEEMATAKLQEVRKRTMKLLTPDINMVVHHERFRTLRDYVFKVMAHIEPGTANRFAKFVKGIAEQNG